MSQHSSFEVAASAASSVSAESSPVSNRSDSGSANGAARTKYLCLTILGYRKAGMSEDAYRHHMNNISAPLTKDLMAKYGVKRWTQIHNTSETRELMTQLFDPQMCNLADYDCFSQVVFSSLEDYKNIKKDPWYKEHLVGDHEKFADTKKSK